MDVRCCLTSGALSRTAKSCGPGAPRSGAKFAMMLAHHAGDGGKRDGSPRRARISRKPSRREGRSVSACTCGSRARANLLCAGAPGAAATRPSLRPLFSMGAVTAYPRRNCAVGTQRRVSHVRDCKARDCKASGLHVPETITRVPRARLEAMPRWDLGWTVGENWLVIVPPIISEEASSRSRMIGGRK